MKITLTPFLNSIFYPFGLHLERIPTDKRPTPDMAALAKHVSEIIRSQTGGRVLSGPFAGMQMAGRNPWTERDEPSRLIGCYEQELHPFIESAIARNPELVMNVGSGDGYYTVGMARRLPRAKVIAFDISPQAQKATRNLAETNHVEERIEVRAACDPTYLCALAKGAPKSLIISDCEGFETELFTPQTMPSFKNSDLLIECHSTPGDIEFCGRLTDIISQSHVVTLISEAGRDPNLFADLIHHSSIIRWMAVCEFRPFQMKWICATPK